MPHVRIRKRHTVKIRCIKCDNMYNTSTVKVVYTDSGDRCGRCHALGHHHTECKANVDIYGFYISYNSISSHYVTQNKYTLM